MLAGFAHKITQVHVWKVSGRVFPGSVYFRLISVEVLRFNCARYSGVEQVSRSTKGVPLTTEGTSRAVTDTACMLDASFPPTSQPCVPDFMRASLFFQLGFAVVGWFRRGPPWFRLRQAFAFFPCPFRLD